ncbi:hypothetical protein [uncultured Desulfobacter sp.]|uniref:hypothetical protein n=1 Tax=uncultured Desulfobacter sp. TaxID=240139 RepID=UPI0029C6B6FD|nr:hypothetical protein [uncultured Desulfobacter sp.]
MFSSLRGVEIYKTVGFKDIALIHGDTEQSYQKTAKLINRIRHQKQGGTPYRTLHECTEKEGREVLDYIDKNARSILSENGFSEDGTCQVIKLEYNNAHPVTVSRRNVLNAVDKCCRDNTINAEDILNNPVPYEDPGSSTQISIDDVHVKKQEEFRPGGIKSERGKRKYIHNTIAHISKAEVGTYVLNGPGTKDVLLFLTAFLFHNGLIGNRIQFFTDGHKTLNNSIFKGFSWYKNIGIILDWYHLEKKCKEQLSLALKGRNIRNETLDTLKPLLWHGLTDKAVAHLESIGKDSIKKIESLDKLMEYLKRNKPYIPCYAVRKELNLCNSSAIGEKMNDLVVSSRQKHNGMSWSKKGSLGLATITAIKRNKENDKWFETKSLDFKLVA